MSKHYSFPSIFALPKISDPRGNLSVIEGGINVPFEIKRVFYLYDLPTGGSRGFHAHRRQHQFLVCLSGSFDVSIDDGCQETLVHLNRPWEGLHVPPMIWAAELNFDPGTVCLVLTSDFYSEDDYIRDYTEFVRLTENSRKN